MDAKTLAGRLATVQVIDVREPFEWQAGRIEGSRHIPLNELPDRLSEIERDRPAVAVCFAGARSAAASRFLQSHGFEAHNLDGGLKSWVGGYLPLTAGEGLPGRLVHDPPPNPSGTMPAEPPGEDLADPSEGSEGDSLSPEMERLKDTFIEVVFAAQEHFGDREPTEDEMRAFMKEWLIANGKTAEEAEEILDR